MRVSSLTHRYRHSTGQQLRAGLREALPLRARRARGRARPGDLPLAFSPYCRSARAFAAPPPT
eukprot:3964151-Pyramimonas_sp.AAC.1